MLTIYVGLRLTSRETHVFFRQKWVLGIEILRTGRAGPWLAWKRCLSCAHLLGSSVSPSVKWDSASERPKAERTTRGIFIKTTGLKVRKASLGA